MSIWEFITNSKKNRFRNKLDFLLSLNLIFTACVACKNQFWNQIDFLIFSTKVPLCVRTTDAQWSLFSSKSKLFCGILGIFDWFISTYPFWAKLGYSRIKIDLLSLCVLYSLQFKIGVHLLKVELTQLLTPGITGLKSCSLSKGPEA